MEPQEKPGRVMQQLWEAQWQDFLQTLQGPHSAWGTPQMSEATPWDDAKAFLTSFEQVAAACCWPRGEWVSRLLPALSGEAQQAFSLLAARDKEDYGKVKAAILRGEALRRERQRQHFRQFCCQELGDPRRMYSQIQELCCQWLKPQRHTKEQILELLILEQFIASLPVDVQSWIRAGGPESGAQAVALLEDFLLSQSDADMVTWQEPLQEWALGPLDVKEEPLDTVQGQISKEPAERFRDTQPNIDGEVVVPERSLGPQVGLDLHPVKKEEIFLLDPVENLRIPAQTSRDVEETRLKMKNYQSGGGESGGSEPPRHVEGRIPENVFMTAKVQEESCGSNNRHGMEPLPEFKESGELTEGLGAACSNLSPMDTVGGKALFSKYGRRNHPKSGLVFKHSGEKNNERSRLGEEIKLKSKLEKHHSSHMEEKKNDCPEIRVKWKSNCLAKHQTIHTAEKTYKCPDCGTSFSQGSNLLGHQNLHTGEKLHKCPNCGKSFSQRANLLTHQVVLTGKKPHQCTECGKNFSRRSTLLIHQVIHTGRKPHKCPDCGKSFSQRSILSTHQNLHTGEKPHKCPDCGKSFSQRPNLLTHQMIHTGKKPHQCPDCGKNFSRKSTLLIHEMTHTGKKPHKCPDCGKSFSRRSHLLRHEMVHTGKKPHQCPDCGRNFSQRSHLLRHQKIHAERNLWVSYMSEKLKRGTDTAD